ncbi:MAG: spore coat protein, partial [bacterium]
ERMLLEDQKKHEEICIQKYQTYAAQVQDPQLKQLLGNYAKQEQQHLDSINQMLSGRIPSTAQGQSGQGQQSAPTTAATNLSGAAANQNDAMLLNDLLMTEKYVSGSYDTAIFEFTNSQMRQVLNHIQKEEQQHGEGIYNYMNAHGMYNPQ